MAPCVYRGITKDISISSQRFKNAGAERDAASPSAYLRHGRRASAIGVSSSLLNVSRERPHATARICRATIAQVRGANWLRFLRHTPSLAAIDFDPSVRSRNIERNYGQFTMPSSPSPNAYPPRGPCRPAAGPVIARRWIGPRIDCFGISIPILRAQPINAPARERGVGVHAAPANATARPL